MLLLLISFYSLIPTQSFQQSYLLIYSSYAIPYAEANKFICNIFSFVTSICSRGYITATPTTYIFCKDCGEVASINVDKPHKFRVEIEHFFTLVSFELSNNIFIKIMPFHRTLIRVHLKHTNKRRKIFELC